MKKIFMTVLAVVLAMSMMLTACGKKAEAPAVVLEGQTPAQIIDALYAVHAPEFGVATIELDDSDPDLLYYMTGLSDLSLVSEIAVSESMIGSQAYSLGVARLAEGVDAETLAQTFADNLDPIKWVCVEADDMRIVACGDVVMFVMVSSEYASSITAQNMVDAFQEICGAEVTVDLK